MRSNRIHGKASKASLPRRARGGGRESQGRRLRRKRYENESDNEEEEEAISNAKGLQFTAQSPPPIPSTEWRQRGGSCFRGRTCHRHGRPWSRHLSRMAPMLQATSLQGTPGRFIFCLFITCIRPSLIMARVCAVRFLSAVRARWIVASSPLPSAQAGPKRITRTRKFTKERSPDKRKNKRQRGPPLIPVCGRHEGGCGQERR